MFEASCISTVASISCDHERRGIISRGSREGLGRPPRAPAYRLWTFITNDSAVVPDSIVEIVDRLRRIYTPLMHCPIIAFLEIEVVLLVDVPSETVHVGGPDCLW